MTKLAVDYQSFLSGPAQKQWRRIGAKRRAGVAAPLFSLYSKQSIGIGELPDLKLLADWCVETGISILQLLPMNDVGYTFAPYDAQSTFALEPMYLRLEDLRDAEVNVFKKEIRTLREEFPAGGRRVRYPIKGAKLALLWKMFQSSANRKSSRFEKFETANGFWIGDYALYKALKENFREASWESWPEEFRGRDAAALRRFGQTHAESLRFHAWLQWQIFEQFSEIKKYLKKNKILLLGDLPFLVARDSADVWSHQDYFKLDLAAGAPPDAYFANGQRWGMPPYRWEKIAERGYDYLAERLRYAQNFYDLFRIDHVVGLFRLWTIALTGPLENGGLNGRFDPPDEREWEEHGRKILSAMIQNTRMLPCAEDLGVVPECSYRLLEEFCIPGMEIPRWTKHWGKSYDFKDPAEYRRNAAAVLSTHDMTPLAGWWEFEAGTVDGTLFSRFCGYKGISFDAVKPELFDPERSFQHRLRWREEIQDVRTLLEILKRPEREVKDLVDFYFGSYHEKERYWSYLQLPPDVEEKPSPKFIRAALEKVHQTASVFSIQLILDWLSLADILQQDSWKDRINFPGTAGEQNWTLVLPLSLESLKKLSFNQEIRRINQDAERI